MKKAFEEQRTVSKVAVSDVEVPDKMRRGLYRQS